MANGFITKMSVKVGKTTQANFPAKLCTEVNCLFYLVETCAYAFYIAEHYLISNSGA
jgi:hypothetical protein